ncbi:MAG: BamA/TamA family outer membrane protein [Flavobacteriia bacterium]|nr:BamA/TamA family outer membrane protein [Flavobacteriia bacterium]
MLQVLFACGVTKHVPKGKFIVKKNNIQLLNSSINKDEINEFIIQQPNTKSLFLFKMKLWVYNHIDSSKVAEKRLNENEKLIKKNKEKQKKQDEINAKRIKKAKEKGAKLYTKKIKQQKDLSDPRMFFKEWLKYKLGEPPVIFDSLLFQKSIEQLSLVLKNKGYLKATVSGEVNYTKFSRAKVTYTILPNQLYVIDSVYTKCQNSTVLSSYNSFILKSIENQLVNKPFDKDLLENYRYNLARFMRDDALYGFSPSHIKYVDVDTFTRKNKVILEIKFLDRMVYSDLNKDSLIPRKHEVTTINEVYFHINDTSSFKGNFKKTVEDLGLSILDENIIRTIDTLNYQKIMLKKSLELDEKRKAVFFYNGELFLDPGLIEVQNFLEKGNYYKDKYVDRSYSYIQQLGLFQSVKIVINEVPNANKVDVHYYLIPSKKQNFSFIPRWSNSNGYLGVSSSINYTNKNLFKGAEKFTFAISGGFESQPPVFGKNEEGISIQQTSRSFNTFEIGPSVKLEIPGLFPIKSTKYYKRQRARTIISTAYNYQNRNDFSREIFQMNYSWKFLSPNKTQVFQVGLPLLSVIKFVNITKSANFQSNINALNDLFLKNTYSDQFIWQDFKFTFEYKNTEKDRKSKATVYLSSSFDVAGNLLKMFHRIQDTTSTGEYMFRGLIYSQFVRLDNQLNISYPINKNRSIHFRVLVGGGLPYGNTATSMPYDYSFFAGGANDNRGWRARTLGPGGYKYYLDLNRIQTQVGDLRIGGTAEYRFSFGASLKGAWFVDAGNIWTIHEDTNRMNSKFSNNWYKQIAVATGLGLRLDLDFFILRLDIGLPIRNPALPKGSNWIFQSMENYQIEVKASGLTTDQLEKLPHRFFLPTLNFGIGYPF